MKRTIALSLFVAVLFMAGCASQYRLPGENEPAAHVKAKVVFDVNKAGTFPPSGKMNETIEMAISLKEGKNSFQVLSKSFPEMLSAKGTQTDIQAFKIHPDRPVTITITMGIKWQTRKLEKVSKTERVPKQVTKSASEYDYSTKRTKYVTKTVTEYENRTKWVDEYVTKTDGRYCSAETAFTPARDAVYLLDYSNLLIDHGCSLEAYRQLPQKDGKFKLIPVNETAGQPAK